MVKWCNEKVDVFINELLGEQTTVPTVCDECGLTIVDRPMSNNGDDE